MSETNMPEGWVVVSTQSVFSQIPTAGKKIQTKSCLSFGRFPVIDQGQQEVSGFCDDETKVISIAKPIVIFGDHTRVIKWVKKDFVPGADGTKVLVANDEIEPKYFFYQLRSIELPDKGYARHFKFLNESEFVVAPLAEQQQIAQKLDELLAQVDTLKTRLDAIPNILKRFRQSVLAAAVSGRLTEEWRNITPISESASALKIRWLTERRNNFEKAQLEKVSLGIIKNPKKFMPPLSPDLETVDVIFPKEWEVVSVSEFSECLDNQRVPVKKDQRERAEGLYPYFGANGEVDRVDEFIFDDDLVMVTEDETFYGRTKPIAYRYTGKCWVNNHAHVLKAPNKIANDFLCYTLMYYKVIPWLTGTTGRAKLGQGSLNALPMGMPPEEEQTEIVRRVEQLFAYADQIEQRVKDAQARVNHLTQSILAKAFRGELTADWRAQNPELISGENSAAALLGRIKTEREAAVKPKRKANV